MSQVRDRVRGRILSAAAALFAQRGFHATTVRDICAKARVNVAAVNYHFTSKENLYFETFRFLLADSAALRNARRPLCVSNAEGWQAELRLWVRSMLEQAFSTNPHHIWHRRMCALERINPSRVMPLLFRSFFHPVVLRLRQLVLMGLPADTGELQIRTWVFGVLGQCLFYLERHPSWEQLLIPDGVPRSACIEQLSQHIVDSVTARLSFARGNVAADGSVVLLGPQEPPESLAWWEHLAQRKK